MLTLGDLEPFRHELLDVAGDIVGKLLRDASKRLGVVEAKSRVHKLATLASGDGVLLLSVPEGKPNFGFVARQYEVALVSKVNHVPHDQCAHFEIALIGALVDDAQ